MSSLTSGQQISGHEIQIGPFGLFLRNDGHGDDVDDYVAMGLRRLRISRALHKAKNVFRHLLFYWIARVERNSQLHY